MASLVDYLKSNKLPSDIGFRSKLYETLNLGSADEYKRGTLTGSTNVKLLSYLQANPDLVKQISGSMAQGTPPPAPAPTPTAQPPANQQATGDGQLATDANGNPVPANNQPAQPQQQPTTLPSSVDQINQFQQVAAGLQKQVTDERAQAQAMLPQVMQNPYSVDQYLQYRKQYGVDDIEAKTLSIDDTIRKTEQDVRQEVKNSGGVATESQIQAIVAERNKPLLLQKETLVEQLNQKYQLLNDIQSLTGKSAEYAKSVYDSLVSQSKSDEATVMNLLSSIMTAQKQEQANQIAQSRLNLEQQKLDEQTLRDQRTFDIQQQRMDDQAKRDEERFAIEQQRADIAEQNAETASRRADATIAHLLNSGNTSAAQVADSIKGDLRSSEFGNYIDISQYTGKDRMLAKQIASQAGIATVSKEDAKTLESIGVVKDDMSDILSVLGRTGPKTWYGRQLSRAETKVAQVFQNDAEKASFNSFGLSVFELVRAAGVQGRVTNVEIDKARQNIPDVNDTLEVAETKVANTQKLLNNIGKSIVGNRPQIQTSQSSQSTAPNDGLSDQEAYKKYLQIVNAK